MAQPGLEDLVLKELGDWFPAWPAMVQHGGVTVEAPLAAGLGMNLALKTPTRILVRVMSFRCRDFPKLFQKISEFKWDDWVDPGLPIAVVGASVRSRLKIKNRIEETCEKAWAKRRKKTGREIDGSGEPIHLYVRFADDVCTVSLDTSGDRLHKRGVRQLVGVAPLRETIAASLIQWLERHTLAAGERPQKPIVLIDPMMGTGVFFTEAALRDQLIEGRGFAWEQFTQRADVPSTFATTRPPWGAFIGFERDPKTCEAARENLDGLAQLPARVDLRNEDFFESTALPECGDASIQRWVIANPPYGERLKVEGPLSEYYAHFFAQIESIARPDLCGLILPSKAGRLALPSTWRVLEKRKFLNGGLSVTAYLFGRHRSTPPQ